MPQVSKKLLQQNQESPCSIDLLDNLGQTKSVGNYAMSTKIMFTI
jgi:hypothetical protein